MAIPKPTPPKTILTNKKVKPRETKTKKQRGVKWNAILPGGKEVSVFASTEIAALKEINKKYNVIPIKIKKEPYVRKDRLTHTPFKDLKNMLKGV